MRPTKKLQLPSAPWRLEKKHRDSNLRLKGDAISPDRWPRLHHALPLKCMLQNVKKRENSQEKKTVFTPPRRHHEWIKNLGKSHTHTVLIQKRTKKTPCFRSTWIHESRVPSRLLRHVCVASFVCWCGPKNTWSNENEKNKTTNCYLPGTSAGDLFGMVDS